MARAALTQCCFDSQLAQAVAEWQHRAQPPPCATDTSTDASEAEHEQLTGTHPLSDEGRQHERIHSNLVEGLPGAAASSLSTPQVAWPTQRCLQPNSYSSFLHAQTLPAAGHEGQPHQLNQTSPHIQASSQGECHTRGNESLSHKPSTHVSSHPQHVNLPIQVPPGIIIPIPIPIQHPSRAADLQPPSSTPSYPVGDQEPRLQPTSCNSSGKPGPAASPQPSAAAPARHSVPPAATGAAQLQELLQQYSLVDLLKLLAAATCSSSSLQVAAPAAAAPAAAAAAGVPGRMPTSQSLPIPYPSAAPSILTGSLSGAPGSSKLPSASSSNSETPPPSTDQGGQALKSAGEASSPSRLSKTLAVQSSSPLAQDDALSAGKHTGGHLAKLSQGLHSAAATVAAAHSPAYDLGASGAAHCVVCSTSSSMHNCIPTVLSWDNYAAPPSANPVAPATAAVVPSAVQHLPVQQLSAYAAGRCTTGSSSMYSAGMLPAGAYGRTAGTPPSYIIVPTQQVNYTTNSSSSSYLPGASVGTSGASTQSRTPQQQQQQCFMPLYPAGQQPTAPGFHNSPAAAAVAAGVLAQTHLQPGAAALQSAALALAAWPFQGPMVSYAPASHPVGGGCFSPYSAVGTQAGTFKAGGGMPVPATQMSLSHPVCNVQQPAGIDHLRRALLLGGQGAPAYGVESSAVSAASSWGALPVETLAALALQRLAVPASARARFLNSFQVYPAAGSSGVAVTGRSPAVSYLPSPAAVAAQHAKGRRAAAGEIARNAADASAASIAGGGAADAASRAEEP